MINEDYVAREGNAQLTFVIKNNSALFLRKHEIITPQNFKILGWGDILNKFPIADIPHVGVFVGVPSIEIRAIIVGGQAMGKIRHLKQTLVNSNKFIPLFDVNMKLIFDAEEFSKLRNTSR